jgi:hypothetical protein
MLIRIMDLSAKLQFKDIPNLKEALGNLTILC